MKERLTPDVQSHTPSTGVEVSRAVAHNGHIHARVPELIDGFQHSVNQWPDQPAVHFRDRVLNYSELDAQSNRLAHWLVGRGIRPDDTVAVCFDKSTEALVTILGILKSGAAYVPLDPLYPVRRLEMIVADSAPAVVIADKPRDCFKNSGSIFWDDLLFQLDDYSPDSLATVANDENLGYVHFTSGSTGRPKGVAMRRGPLRNLINWQMTNSLAGPGDATLQFALLSFDVSFQEVFSTWATGGVLVVPSEMERQDPILLARLIETNNISRLFCPFVLLQQIAESWREPPQCLREIITAGEQLQITDNVRRFFRQLPNCRLQNQYGPTETHVVTSHSLSGPPAGWPNLPPIGQPIDNAIVYVVDENGKQTDTGEIWIGGNCLARGYLGQPETTPAGFGADPFRTGGRIYRTGDIGRWNSNGELEFLGRLDRQVKIRGFRVEPGEIEITLCSHPAVREAVVVTHEPTLGDRRIIAYFARNAKTDANELREHLRQRLPDYMMPSAFVALSALPRIPNGKIDREALPLPSRGRPTLAVPFVSPRSALEESIANIWREVLHIDQVGVHDPFFDLGGNSLGLARVNAKLRDLLHHSLSITDLFRFPTIAGLATELSCEKTSASVNSTRSRIKSLREPIAIVGMAGRFPKAADVNQLWKNLCAGVEGISFFSDDELRASGISESLIDHPDYVKARGVLSEADCFDATFFGFQPREAELTDPQQRVLLETAWAALEDAGIVPDRIAGRIGVFAGMSMNTYLLHNVLATRAAADQFLAEFQSGGYPTLIGNDKDYLASRVAFKLNLRGPAVSIQTACSTSLVAVAEAVESLRAGSCDMALAGGVSITFPQKRGSVYQDGAITSPDGHCRPFDADANGTVFGEGAAIVVLKRLDEAIADRNLIYAVIKGVGLSNDGCNKVSYLAPSVDGQAQAYAYAIAQADVDPASVGFIETHGTGTPMGDPIEVAALAKVYKKQPNTPTCHLGSLKSNIGHLEAAAGVTGLIKAALSLHHCRIPGTLHYRKPHPELELDRTRFAINAETIEWRSMGPRRAAVTSLGVGGTNAHLVLEEAPTPPAPGPSLPQQLLLISARSPAALDVACRNLAHFLCEHPEVDLADVAFSLRVGRRAFEHRRAIVASSIDNAIELLYRPANRVNNSQSVNTTPPIALLQVIDDIGTLSQEREDVISILQSVGELWVNGIEIDWSKSHALSTGRRIALPTYPFERQRFWIDPPTRQDKQNDSAPESTDNPPGIQSPPLPTSDRKSTYTIQLQSLFADLAGVTPESIVPACTYFELGFDSLVLTQAVHAIYDNFGITIGFRQLLESVPTIESLAEFLDQNVANVSESLPNETSRQSDQPIEALVIKPVQPKGFGAFEPIDRSTETDWSPRQLRFLDGFVNRWIKKTANSKAHIQEHRESHADPRTVTGFTRLWKEIIFPLVIDRSSGSRLWDIDGNEYIDLLNGFGPDLLGHSPPFVIEAIEKQLRSGYEVGPTSPLAGELADLICEITGMERASFVCTGSEAVQAALRAARTVTGRDKVVTFAGDYHGNFDEVLLRSGGDPSQCPNPSVPGIPRSAVNNMIALDYGTPESIEFIRQHAHELAAVLVEPVQSRRPELQPRQFLHDLREITKAAGACLIFDEVVTGFRLHLGGAQAFFDVRADLATYGKIIGGGMPIGAVAGRSKFMDAFDGGMWNFGDESFPTAGRTFFAGTFVRHPLALAAGLATLRHLQNEGPTLQQRLNAAGDQLVGRLNEIARNNRVPLEIVNCGSLMFFRFLNGGKEASLLFYLLRERGVYILEGFPSYISTAHSPADFEQIEKALRDSLVELRSHGFFAGRTSKITPTTADEWIPLTEAQREIWLAAQGCDDASRAFNETCTLRLHGPFDVESFRRSVKQLVSRHDALRAVFDPGGRCQRFLNSLEIEIPLIDLSELSLDDRVKTLQLLQAAEDQHVFDLANGPLLRIQVVGLAADDHAVMLTAHHIACDGWSYDIILHELGVIYSAEINNDQCRLTPADSFKTYALDCAARDQDRELHYWTRKFTPAPNAIELPVDHPRPNRRTHHGSRISKPLGQRRTETVKQLAVHLGCTPYVTLLAGFDALLMRLSGHSDIVVGIPTAGQASEKKKSLVGHCAHFLPIRQNVDSDKSFANLANAVMIRLLDAFEHHDFTYISLLKTVPNSDPARPLVSVGFNLDPALRDLGFANIQVAVEKNPKHFVNLELHWNLVDTGTEYLLEVEFNTDVYDSSSITRWIEHYCTLLDDAANRPYVPIAELQLLNVDDRRKMLVAWNKTERLIPHQAVHELFEEQVERHPNAPAVVGGQNTVTYAELNRKANRLARHLRERGVKPDVPVPVLLNRSPELIIALLGIMKAGGAYLPLDLTHPAARNARLVSEARASMVVSSATIPGHDALGVPIVELETPQFGDHQNLPSVSVPNHMAAVMYTSGSTGVPKGVMISHRGIVRLLFNSGFCQFGPERTFAFVAPVAFDAAIFEIWGALLHGGKLAVFPSAVLDPDELGNFLHRHQVNTLWLTAGLFNAIVDRNVKALSGIRQLLTGGEAMSLTHARRALASLPNTTIINCYGPTESTTFATTWQLPPQLPDDLTTAPIGRPIGNTTVAVLDSHKQPVPIGVVGDLFIGGAGVTRGYLNAAELTTERFIPSPIPELGGTLYSTGDRVCWGSDGQLEFRGRIDQQVKIRGYRVELGEIEAALASHQYVAQCAIVVHGSGMDSRLVAYVVPKRKGPLDAERLRVYLADRLPVYMVPNTVVFLDALPLMANGKLDRSNLPEPPAKAELLKHERIAPRTDAEVDLLKVWADILGQPELCVTDDFFDLGGHSLKAIELIAAVRDRLGHSLPLGALYDAPTVAQFAAVIQKQLEAGSDKNLVLLREGSARHPLFMVAGVGGHVFAFHKFSRLLDADRPSYGVKAIGVDGTRPPPDRMEDIAAAYVNEMIAAQPEGPFVLAGYSLGAVVAFEVALQLRALDFPVPLLIAIDGAAPGYLNYSIWKRMQLHFTHLVLRGAGWAYVKQRGNNLIDKLNWRMGRGDRNAPTIAGLEMFSQEAITQVWVALHKAYKRYKPSQKYDGQMLVIRADVVEDWDKFVSADPQLGWGQWTIEPVEAHGLPVRHLDLFHEPTIFDLARLVNSGLSRFESR